MKKIVAAAGLLCVIFVLLFSGCSRQSAGFKAGTYTGSSKGMNGDVTVEVTLTADKIADVKVVKHQETAGVSDPAFAKIPKAIVETQSLAIDSVSGATLTSNAILGATASAVKKAGGDPLKLRSASAQTVRVPDATKTADVIVIGGGGAGLAAAVSAHQNGASVIVLEKMPTVGGNTIISGAAYNAVDPKRQKALNIEDSVEKHFQQTYEGGDKKGDPALIRTLVSNAPGGVEWLESLGMQFTDNIFTVLGALWPRSHKPVKPLGTGYIDTFMEYINKNNIEVLFETRAVELTYENMGRVTGVIAKGPTGNTITLTANKGVVMATGGFGANVDMRQMFNTEWKTLNGYIKTTNQPGATGDGILMASGAGAALVGMQYIQLLPMGDPVTGSLSGNIEQGVENRIFVNKQGNRFVAEDERRDVMTEALFKQPDAAMWVILDKHSYPSGDVKNNFNESIDELVAAGRAYKADTLEDLASQIKVDPANLVKAVAEFNKAVERKGGDAYGRKLFADKIDTAPFYAGARIPTVHHTMGGVKIDTEARVIGKDGKAIPGFYAAGEVTGGIHGSNRLGGNALADVTVFGKIAGESAAKGK